MVITTYNRPDALAAVVEACFAQSDKNFEIIIADDGSTANTKACVDALKKRSPVPLTHVWQPAQDFRAAMARRGRMVCGSRVLLSTVLTTRVLAGQVDRPDANSIDHCGYRLGGHLSKLLQLLLRWPDIRRATRRFSWRRIKSCNLGVWRSDLDTVDGFDQSFQGWGHEDAELAVRLFNAGVMRKDGAFATKVFHLWHHEAQRDQAAGNRKVVLERTANKTILPSQGMAANGAGLP